MDGDKEGMVLGHPRWEWALAGVLFAGCMAGLLLWGGDPRLPSALLLLAVAVLTPAALWLAVLLAAGLVRAVGRIWRG